MGTTSEPPPLHSWNWFCYWKWNEVFWGFLFFIFSPFVADYGRVIFACYDFRWLTARCRFILAPSPFYVRNSINVSLWWVPVIPPPWFTLFKWLPLFQRTFCCKELSSHEIAWIIVFKSNLSLSRYLFPTHSIQSAALSLAILLFSHLQQLFLHNSGPGLFTVQSQFRSTQAQSGTNPSLKGWGDARTISKLSSNRPKIRCGRSARKNLSI